MQLFRSLARHLVLNKSGKCKLESSDFAKRAPEFMAVLTGTGEYAYQAEEGIYVIPLRALGV